MMLRVLIADDHQLFCEGLRALLACHADIEVTGVASTGEEAVRLALSEAPDVVLMDVAMPDLNGVEATRRIREARPDARVIALSMHADRHFVDGMLEAGVSGYLTKECAADELVRAIHAVTSGKTYLSPDVASVVVDGYTAHRSARAAHPALTTREREVLGLLAGGQSTRSIARALHISVKTVETHRRQIMEKLDIHSVAELTKYAIREGLTTLR